MSVLAVILDAAPGARPSFAGRPLAEHALALVAAARPVDRIIIVGGDAAHTAAGAGPGVSAIPAPPPGNRSEERPAAMLSQALAHLDRNERFAADVAVLVDPVCPLLAPGLIEGALDHLRRCGADTLVSVHGADGPLWLEDAEGRAAPLAPAPDRPCYIENGAITAVRAGVFQQTGTLPSGRTVLYPIPITAALRPSSEVEWVAAEMIARATGETRARAHLKRVRLICFDFDGVMTDNRVLVMEDGSEGVLCNRSDGLGLERLRAAGMPVAVVSKERNPVVAARCRKLKIPCHQGIEDKLPAVRGLAADHGIALADIAYVGNDINDLACMGAVGVAVAPADAYPEVLAVAHLVMHRAGGFGAVRELCDLILAARAETGSNAP
jgi:N-acylneuraminate cytidylyltransferase